MATAAFFGGSSSGSNSGSSSGSNSGSNVGFIGSGLYKRVARAISSNNQNYGLAMHLHRYCMEGVRIIMRVLGPALVLLASSLLLFVLYVFFTLVLPSLAMGSPLLYSFHLAVGTFFIVSVFFNYLSCALIPAGAPVPCDEPGRYLGRSVHYVDGRAVTTEHYRLEVRSAVPVGRTQSTSTLTAILPNPQSPIPNPQSPIPNPHTPKL